MRLQKRSRWLLHQRSWTEWSGIVENEESVSSEDVDGIDLDPNDEDESSEDVDVIDLNPNDRYEQAVAEQENN